MMANFMKEKEAGKSLWSLATEPKELDTESDNGSPNDEVLCEKCNRKLTQSSNFEALGS